MSCPACGVPLEGPSGNCSNCGWSMPAAPPPPQVASVLQDKLAAALCYVTFIPAILALVIEPYRRRRFVRFHSFQSIFFFGATVVVLLALGLLSPIILGHLVTLLLLMLFALGWSILWLVLVAKALQGEYFMLPQMGSRALQWAQGQ
jgi:uncharacterized membrane protein